MQFFLQQKPGFNLLACVTAGPRIRKYSLYRRPRAPAMQARIYLIGVLEKFHFVLFWAWGVRLDFL